VTTLKPLTSSNLQPSNPVTLEPLKEGWRWVRLGEVCEITMGQSPPGASYNSDGLGVPLLNGPTEFGPINPTPVQWTISPTRFAEPGDILLCVRGATTGRKNIADRRYCVGRGLAAIQGRNEQATTSFLWFVLDIFTGSLIGQTSGSTFPNLPGEKLKRVEIPLPPLPEQNRIAAKIQELMQEVERARTACEKQLEAAKSLPAAYLRDLFESEEAEMWDRKRLAEVREKFVNGGTPDTSVPTYWDGNIPWITGADITSFWVSGGRKFITEEGLKNSATHLVPKNTVLVVTRTGVGKVGIAANDLSFSQDITGVICGAKILPEFLARFLLFQGDTLIRIQRGATIKGLTRDDIESLKVPLPSFSIQYSTVSYLKEKMAEVEKLRISIEKQLEAINALPQTVLRKAFRGEL